MSDTAPRRELRRSCGDGGAVVTVSVPTIAAPTDYEHFLRHACEQALKDTVRTTTSLSYGSWQVILRWDGNTADVWEYDYDGEITRRGADLAVSIANYQRSTCLQHGAEYVPPSMQQMIVISDGVFEGDAVQGVRYPSPEHMSGWWITSDRYNGDVKTLRTEHLYHLAAKRADLVPLLALPFGYRFDLAVKEDVWFDATTLR